MAGLTLLGSVASVYFTFILTELTSTQNIQIVVSKVIVLSVLFTAAIWCGRLYKASLHQAAINRHRALSLMTFTAFTAAASDEQTKNAVLMETTRAIFNAGSTGYFDDKGSDDSGLKIVEVFKSINQSRTQ